MNAPDRVPLRLTEFSHGGGCGCKIAPGVLQRDPRQGRSRGCSRSSCSSASRRPTTPPSTRSTTRRRSSRRPTSSCRSSTIRSTSARSPRPTRSPTSTRWAARRCSRWRSSACRSTSCRSTTIRKILEGGEVGVRARRHSRSPAATRSIRSSRSTGSSPSASSIPSNLKRNAGARPGDRLVLGKPLGVGIYSAALKKEKLVAGRLRSDAREHDAAQHAGHRARQDRRACTR